MQWYYANGQERIGPLTDAELADLVKRGVVGGDTLVWHEGMTDWVIYSSLPGVETPPAASVPAPEESGTCSQCGRSFPADDLIEYEGVLVCGACKEEFFQRLREGGALPGVMEYAGFWIRLGAIIIDGFILGAVNMVIGMLMIPFMMNIEERPELALIINGASMILRFAISIVYEGLFVGKFQATPGKMACGIRIIRADGSNLTYARSFGRTFAKILSGVPTLWIGYLIVAFDSEKRGLHDHICDTRVIKK